MPAISAQVDANTRIALTLTKKKYKRERNDDENCEARDSFPLARTAQFREAGMLCDSTSAFRVATSRSSNR